MSKSKRQVERVRTELEIDEDINLHEKGWKVQTVGWCLMFAFLLAAGAGLFGDGFLSKMMVAKDNVLLKYQRFFRYEARMELNMDLYHRDSSKVLVSFPNSYLKNFRLESVLPEPESSSISGDRTNYYFSGTDHLNITFFMIPQKRGNMKGEVKINNSRFTLSHFIYP